MERDLSLGRRLRNLFWRLDPRAEIDAEVAHHLEMMVQEGIEHGLSRAEAEAEARRRFGAEEPVRDDCEAVARARNRRRSWRDRLDRIGADIRWAFRALKGAPIEATASVLTLGIVTAANALIFGVVFAVALKPLPYRDADRIVTLNEITPNGDRWEVSQPNLDVWRAQATSFTAIAGWLRNEVTLRTELTPRLQAAVVTGDFFGLLGSPPALGRTLSPSDQASAEGGPIVLSYRAWRTHFGADPTIVGRTIRVDAETHEVVGVMPESFRAPSTETDIWIPLGPTPPWMRNRAVHVVNAFARLAPNGTAETAAMELTAIARRIETDFPGEDPKHVPAVRGLRDAVIGDSGTILLLLQTGVAAILLIAVINLAGLALTRAVARNGELAVRAALGASRTALARQLVIESGLVGLVGGAIGALGAVIAVGPLVRLLPSAIPQPAAIGIDWFIVAGTVALGGLAGVAIGALTAFRSTRAGIAGRLATASGKSTISRRDARLERGLVGAQLGATVILLATAGLLIRSLSAAAAVEPGFRRQGLVTATVSLATDRFDPTRTLDWFRGLPDRLGRIPGIVGATATNTLPISGGEPSGQITAEGIAFAPGEDPAASFRRILPNYFSVMDVPLIRGRFFTADDLGRDELVVIVNAAMANRLWPGQDPIGRRIKVGPPEGKPWMTVVGVVGDVRNIGLDFEPRFDTYEPLAQRLRSTMTVVLRTDGDPEPWLGRIRSLVGESDGAVMIWGARTMSARIAESLAPRRFPAQVMAGFGVIGLLLASIGVYAITAQAVRRRNRELAIRMALGARPRSIEHLVIGQTLSAGLVGVAVGLAGAFVAGRAMTALLFRVGAADVVTFAIAPALLIAAMTLAAWLPGRRASRANPLDVIRDSR